MKNFPVPVLAAALLAVASAALPAAASAAPTGAAGAEAAAPARYLVLDLSDGPREDACYPVRFLAAPPPGGWGDEYRTNLVALRRIDPGSVLMGAGPGELGYTGAEMPLREVRISRPYYIGVFELTQEQWRRIAGARAGRYPGPMRPAESVSWTSIRGARAGASWPETAQVDEGSLLGLLRDRTCIGSWDLPTEAQWEYACRAGSTNSVAEGLDLSSSGHDPGLDRFARYSTGVKGGAHGVPQHADVGRLEPNAWGLYDMHGNVAEWCLDRYAGRAGFSDPEPVDPVGPAAGHDRVVRGGSWFDYARLCRSASRARLAPGESNPRTGLRLVCSPPTAEELEAALAMAADVAERRAEAAAPRGGRR